MAIELPPAEAALFRSGDLPAPMLDIIGAMATQAASAAQALGVFDALAADPADATELAVRLRADEAGLGTLLEFLAATGYLHRSGGRYTTAPVTEAWVTSGYGTALRTWAAIIGEFWGDLAAGVATGRPRADFYDWLATRPDDLARFQGLQGGLADWLADEVFDLAELPSGPGHVLDLGGGNGRFAAALCHRRPDLAVTVADLPVALAAGRELGLPDRVAFVPADLATGEIPAGEFDAVLLFNVLHGFAEPVAEGLVRAAGRRGRVHVLETVAPPPGGVAEAAFTAGFAVSLWLTQGGRLHPVEQVARWLGPGAVTRPLTRSATHILLSSRS